MITTVSLVKLQSLYTIAKLFSFLSYDEDFKDLLLLAIFKHATQYFNYSHQAVHYACITYFIAKKFVLLTPLLLLPISTSMPRLFLNQLVSGFRYILISIMYHISHVLFEKLYLYSIN